MRTFKLIPSVDRLFNGAVTAWRRFPLALLCGVFASIIAVILIHYRGGTDTYHLLNKMLTLLLGIPLFIAFTLIGERQKWSVARQVIMQVVGIVILVLYTLSLPPELFRPHFPAFRLLLLGFALHFLVAFGPWVGKERQQGFWQYNKSMLLGMLTAAAYSASLYVGLAIALGAAQYLFGLEVRPERYFELLVLMAGIVNTWIFLALVPRDLDSLITSDQYPNGLKIFTQYVLLPLVGLYFVILIAYELKIIVEWNWPKGWVSQLVLWYSVIGILSLLLLHPLREREGSKWIARFSEWYFRLLIPLVIMLFLAIRRRIIDYGVTEPRYLVVLLAVGLAVVVLYFVLSRRKDIRFVPITLFALAIIGAYGPLSATSISTWSQRSRLEALMVENCLLKDDVLQKPTGTISKDQREKMSSTVSYLLESRGPEAFAGWLSDSTIRWAVTRQTADHSSLALSQDISSALGFEFTEPPIFAGEEGFVSLWAKESGSVDIAGFEKMLLYTVSSGEPSDTLWKYSLGDYSCRIGKIRDSSVIAIVFDVPGDTVSREIRWDLAGRVESLRASVPDRQVPQDSLLFDRSVDRFRTRLLVRNLSGQVSGGKFTLTSLGARLLIHYDN